MEDESVSSVAGDVETPVDVKGKGRAILSEEKKLFVGNLAPSCDELRCPCNVEEMGTDVL